MPQMYGFSPVCTWEEWFFVFPSFATVTRFLHHPIIICYGLPWDGPSDSNFSRTSYDSARTRNSYDKKNTSSFASRLIKNHLRMQQISHRVPVCSATCRCQLLLTVNWRPHSLQTKGFTPRCERMCCSRRASRRYACEKRLSWKCKKEEECIWLERMGAIKQRSIGWGIVRHKRLVFTAINGRLFAGIYGKPWKEIASCFSWKVEKDELGPHFFV